MEKAQLVNVYGKKMSIKYIGSGEKTIILLPGFGIPLPTTLFKPLMKGLAENYQVCTIDLFGYGYSDSSEQPRTNKNIVEEIRETLRVSGFKPPYILMPYSAAGIYCEYYSIKYPSEVEALILIDGTPTIEEFAEQLTLSKLHISAMKKAFDSQNRQSKETLEKSIAQEIQILKPHGFTEEDIRKANSVMNNSDTLIAQAIELSQNIREVQSLIFPQDLPVLVLLSDNATLSDKDVTLTENYRKAHLANLAENSKSFIVRESTHSDIIYNKNSLRIIVEEVIKFIPS